MGRGTRSTVVAACAVLLALPQASCGAAGASPGTHLGAPGRITLTDPGIAGLRSSAVVEKTIAGKKVSGRVLLIASRPSSLRIDAMSPADTPLAILTADAEGFSLSDMGSGTFYMGPPSECNVARLLDIPLPPGDVVGMLLGMPPMIEASGSTVAWVQMGYHLMTLTNPPEGIEQTVQVVSGPKGDHALRSVVTHGGSVLYDLRFVHWQPAAGGGPLLPREIRFAMPGQGMAVALRYDSISVDPPVGPATFEQDPPPGFAVHWVDCQPSGL